MDNKIEKLEEKIAELRQARWKTEDELKQLKLEHQDLIAKNQELSDSKQVNQNIKNEYSKFKERNGELAEKVADLTEQNEELVKSVKELKKYEELYVTVIQEYINLTGNLFSSIEGSVLNAKQLDSYIKTKITRGDS